MYASQASLLRLPPPRRRVARGKFFILIIFYSSRDASHAEIWFMIHSHISWPRSGDCGGSRIRSRDSCVLCLVSPSCFNQLSHHIPTNWATTSPTEPPHPREKFACGSGMPASDAPAERGCPQGCSCGAGTPASDAPAGRGRPEETVWQIFGALKRRLIQGAVRLWASDAGEEILPCGEMMLLH
jgi:hypothetical protein